MAGDPHHFLRREGAAPDGGLIDHTAHDVTTARQVADQQGRHRVTTYFGVFLVSFAVGPRGLQGRPL